MARRWERCWPRTLRSCRCGRPSTGRFTGGPDAGAQYCAAVEESWENLRWEIEEMHEGGDWVLALGHIRGRGRGSGVDVDARAGWVARFREGEVTNFHTYADRADAFDAVGLSGSAEPGS
jgi:ketosteroid isomerase-like protein